MPSGGGGHAKTVCDSRDFSGGKDMKRLMLGLMAAVLCYGSAAHAVESMDFKAKTTRNLVNLCSVTWGDEQYGAAMGFCLGFVDAAMDYHRVITSGDLVKPVACPQETVTRQELVDVFLAWAKANPTMLDNESPIQGVMRAASAKWPCKK